ncbi:MAG TPA: hypothetical protein VM451_01685 [Candidatus Limnocylindria bacterium]|nr:hypothetical protein [Candidatus Limnocylindria bacterium]
MRPSRTVARAALTATLALGALPGLVGSHEPGQDRPIDAALFEQVNLASMPDRQGLIPYVLDRAGQSAGTLAATEAFAEVGSAAPAGTPGSPDERAAPALAAAKAGWGWKAPRATMRGEASFYSAGFTAMRDVPRGTTIVICGNGGCIETTVTDYGPAKSTGRIIDMNKPDFFRICGCGWWSGTTQVTVRIY